jgi:hypothetical protein
VPRAPALSTSRLTFIGHRKSPVNYRSHRGLCQPKFRPTKPASRRSGPLLQLPNQTFVKAEPKPPCPCCEENGRPQLGTMEAIGPRMERDLAFWVLRLQSMKLQAFKPHDAAVRGPGKRKWRIRDSPSGRPMNVMLTRIILITVGVNDQHECQLWSAVRTPIMGRPSLSILCPTAST